MRWKFHIPLGLAIAFIVVAPAIFGSFTITLMNYIGIYAFAVLGLVLLTGVGGLTSFGQAAFVGIGAYATAWYTAVHGGSPWIGLLLALLLTGLVATVLGAATLRLSGHFLPLSTIAWGIAIFFLFGNIDAIGRYSGLSGIPAITIGPISLGGNLAMYCFIWGLLGIVMLLCRNLLDSRKGRAIRSLRGGIAMVESLAIDSFRMRLAIFVFAGMLAGLSGWLYAHMQRYVSPAPFDVRPSIEPVLTIQGATKRFGALAAVNDVSFEVKGGEVLGLIGPNGAGKSTLLNLITGTAKPNAGRIMFLDHDVTKLAPRHIAARGVARTFQHVKLRPNMTLLDNALLGTYSRTRSGFLAGAVRLDRDEEKSAQFEALQQLKRVGLAEKAGELAGSLPLGQQRLLEVARALAADPVVVILDEPAAGLRSLEKQILSQLLRTLRNEGMTIVLVEHDMEFVMNLVDRIVVMDFGLKLAEGVPADIRAEPRVQEAYLGGVA